MRLAPLLATALLSLPFATISAPNAACSPGAVCNCPASAVPQAAISLPCDTTPLPTLSLSGVCAGTGSEQNGQLFFGSSEAGTCHVQLTFPDGSTYATDVDFAGQWLACGSDPHGCGQMISPVGLSTPPNSIFATLVVPGAPCADAGPPGDDAGGTPRDAASESD